MTTEHKIPEGLKVRQWVPCGYASPGGKDHDPHWWNSEKFWCDGWPGPFPELHGAQGCATGCKKVILAGGTHTLRWGECAKADPPPPRVNMSKIYTDYDGYPSIGFDSYTETELAELIEPALREVRLMSGRELELLGEEERLALARAAAHAIIHRNDRTSDE